MKVMLNVFMISLVVLANIMFIYQGYLRVCDYMIIIKNDMNNKSIKKKLHDPDELNNIFENLGGM